MEIATAMWCCPRGKEIPDSATSNGYHFAFSAIFHTPFGKYMLNQEVEIGKMESKGEFLRYLVKGVYSLSFTIGISFLLWKVAL